MTSPDKATYFASAGAFYRWLERHHARARELWVGYYKKATGRPTLTWAESVDQALCFGWIDGIRKRVDAERYTIRFTPRRPRSYWSAINIRRVQAMKRAGLMRQAGLEAFARRSRERTQAYTYEGGAETFPPRYEKVIRGTPGAWAWFSARPPGYRRNVVRWVMLARQESTRERRLALLIQYSARGKPIPPLAGKASA